MPCVQQVMNQGRKKTPTYGSDRPSSQSPHGFYSGEKNLGEEKPQPYPMIDVGDSQFIIKSGDRTLIEELRLFSESLKGTPRAEVRFTNKLVHCTQQSRLQPWGWQRLPMRGS